MSCAPSGRAARAPRRGSRGPSSPAPLLTRPLSMNLVAAEVRRRKQLRSDSSASLPRRLQDSGAEIAGVGGPLVLSMNLPQIQGDRRWGFPSVVALNLRELLGGSWSQCAAFGPCRLPVNRPKQTQSLGADKDSQAHLGPSKISGAWSSDSGAEIAGVGGPLVLSINLPQIQGDRRWGFPSVVALNLRELLGGSWSQCAAFGPCRLPVNRPKQTQRLGADKDSQAHLGPSQIFGAWSSDSGAEIAAVGGPWVLSLAPP